MSNENDSSSPKLRNESDVYDRQIRLWGAEAQAKMSKAKVLYINLTGVSSEILKNLVLAGIRPVLCDNRKYPDAVFETPSLFWPSSHAEAKAGEDEPVSKKAKLSPPPATVGQAAKSVVEELNPLLGECQVLDCDPSDIDLTDENTTGFDCIIASHISMDVAVPLSKDAAARGTTFFLVDSFGMYGACAMDWGPNFQFRPEKGKQLLDVTTLEPYVDLETLLAVPLQDQTNRFHKKHPPEGWLFYRCLLEYVRKTKSWPADGAEFANVVAEWITQTSPGLAELSLVSKESLYGIAKVAVSEIVSVCTVLGGFVGNEVIKAISGKGEPANNTLIFDGISCKVWTFLVKPKE